MTKKQTKLRQHLNLDSDGDLALERLFEQGAQALLGYWSDDAITELGRETSDDPESDDTHNWIAEGITVRDEAVAELEADPAAGYSGLTDDC